jgi:DNA-binding XRE family transcriptional regulator
MLQTDVSTTRIIPCGEVLRKEAEIAGETRVVVAKKSAANVALGAAARSLRAERGLPQEALATLAGIDRSYYGAIERGEFNVSLDTIVKIAAALEVTAAALLTRAEL